MKEKHMSHLSIRGIFRWEYMQKYFHFLQNYLCHVNMRNKTIFLSKLYSPYDSHCYICVLMTTPMMLKSLRKSSVGFPDCIWIYVGSNPHPLAHVIRVAIIFHNCFYTLMFVWVSSIHLNTVLFTWKLNLYFCFCVKHD